MWFFIDDSSKIFFHLLFVSIDSFEKEFIIAIYPYLGHYIHFYEFTIYNYILIFFTKKNAFLSGIKIWGGKAGAGPRPRPM